MGEANIKSSQGALAHFLNSILPYWLPFLLLTTVNIFLATQTWDQIRSDFGWVRAVPQSDAFKLRHFIEFSPQAFFAFLALRMTTRWTFLFSGLIAMTMTMLVGGLSEAVQLFIPQRIASLWDVFLNYQAALVGVLLYAAAEKLALVFNAKEKIQISIKTLCIFSFLIGGVLFTYFKIFKFGIFADSWRLLTAFHIPGADQFSYWLNIFSTTTNGPQYRPISFFAIFYWVQYFFGDAIWPFRLLGLMLLSGTLFLLFCIIRHLAQNRGIATLLTLFFALHFSVFSLIFEISHIEKYFLPLFELTLGLYLIYFNYHQRKAWFIPLVLLAALAIMSHEGSFVFPFIFVAFDLVLGRKLRPKHALLAAPAVCYLLARFFYFGVPGAGFMKVDILSTPFTLPHYLKTLIIPQPILSDSFAGIIVFFLFSGLSIYAYKKWNSRLVGFFWFSTLLAILPFSVLSNHVVPNRSMWAQLLFTLMLAAFSSKLVHISGLLFLKRVSLGVVTTFVLLHFVSIELYEERLIKTNSKQALLKNEIHQKLNEKIKSYQVPIMSPTELSWIYRDLFPGFLARTFPEKTFLIELTYSGGGGSEILVKDKTYYTKNDSGWADPFNFQSQVEIPRPQKSIKISTEHVSSLFR